MFKDIIMEYAEKNPVFTIDEIHKYVGVSEKEKPKFNTEITRLEKKGNIKRIDRGIYVKPSFSAFGISLPNEYSIVNKIFLSNSNGYSTGPTFLNQIGLCTWIPQKTYVKSNLFKKKIELKSFVIGKPKAYITKKNQRYLQILDSLNDLKNYAIDHDNPDDVIIHYIKEINLDITELLLYAHKYFDRTVVDRLFKILENYYDIT